MMVCSGTIIFVEEDREEKIKNRSETNVFDRSFLLK